MSPDDALYRFRLRVFTLAEELGNARGPAGPIPKYTGLRLDLDRYVEYYNTNRAHTGRWTRGRAPEAVLGKEKMWTR